MTPRWVRGLLFVEVALLGCGGGSLPLPPLSTCNHDWVVPAKDPVYADSLPVDAPKLVWSLTLNGAPNEYGSGPVLAGDRLVLATGEHLFFVTKDGRQTEDMARNVSACQGQARDPWSPPTADSQGNVYVVGSWGLCSLTSTGSLRWARRGICSAVPGGGGELPQAYQCGAAVLSSDGKLFAGASGGKVYALDSGNGSMLWSAPARSDSTGYMSSFYGGGGNQLLLHIADQGYHLLDATSGKTIGPMNVWCGAYSVGAIGWMSGFECRGGAEFFDTCHVPVAGNVTGERRAFAPVTAPGERLVMYYYGVDVDGRETGSRYITLYNPDGSFAAGPVTADGIPFAVGADGTIYAFMCEGLGPRFAAYSRDLQQLWLLDLPGRCYRWLRGAVLDGDGMLYVASEGERYETTDLHAIQTRSPGLADSSWPHWRHDNRGTGWLDQPVRGPAIDASASDAEFPRTDGGGGE